MSRKHHSKNRLDKPTSRRTAPVVLGSILAAALAIGGVFAYGKLSELWIAQCAIDDPASQVEVLTTGKMVSADTIRDAFGIRKGENLWRIDFVRKRKEVLGNPKYATIKDISVQRQMPDRAVIAITEREPAARLNLAGSKANSGRVVDMDGVVFLCSRGVSMLPVIKEPNSPGTQPGQTLGSMEMAALKLLEAAKDAEFQELGIIEVDTSKPDYLCAVLGNYHRAKIAWEGMRDNSPRYRENMLRVMRNLRDAINARLTTAATVWNATEPDRVYADTKETIR